MTMRSDVVWFQTDEAWDFLPVVAREALPVVDVRQEACGLRFITAARRIEAFAQKYSPAFRPFTLFGSGDFHHLSGVWIRQFTSRFHLVSFDNHPDWDIRPPRWSCGAWINRALELQNVGDVSIWGCGNFECNFPTRLLGNRRDSRTGRLQVYPWEQTAVSYPEWLHPLRPETWKDRFNAWVAAHAGGSFYVTIDMDCLTETEAATNWEQGRYTCADIQWALATLRRHGGIVGGDLCGARSQPVYATRFQKLAGWFDHPAPKPASRDDIAARNGFVFSQLWPALISSQPSGVGGADS